MTDFFSEITKITNDAVQSQHMETIATIKVDLINSAKKGETSKLFFNTGLTLGQAKRAFPGFEIDSYVATQSTTLIGFKMTWLRKCSDDKFFNLILDMAKEEQLALVPSFEKKWKEEIKKAATEGKTEVTIEAPHIFVEVFQKLYSTFLPFRMTHQNNGIYLSW